MKKRKSAKPPKERDVPKVAVRKRPAADSFPIVGIGGKGRTNLRYVLLGSTAERLLSLLPCSVLVVKLPAG